MGEIWKEVKGFDGYLVSNLGRVKSLKHKGEHIMSAYTGKIGYKVFTFTRNKKIVIVYLHRLLAEAFIPNPDNKKVIDHIDGCRTNNDLSNLRWVTHKENMNNPLCIKKMKEAVRPPITDEAKIKLRENYRYDAHEKPVKCIDTGIVYQSAAEAFRQTGVNFKGISRVCTGKRKSYHGTHWEFANNN